MRRWFMLLFAASWAAGGEAPAFPGWQSLRVMRIEGFAADLLAADLDGDGRDEIVCLNLPQSRLEICDWLAPSERTAPKTPPADRPNELPMAREFVRHEVQVEGLPQQVCVVGTGKDATLWVATGRNQVRPVRREGRTWTLGPVRDLLPPAAIQGRLLVFPGASGPELLVPMAEGIQVVPLAANQRTRWLWPRETTRLMDWRLADLDGDGDLDLIEVVHAGEERLIRWRENQQGVLRPPQRLYDKPFRSAAVRLRSDGRAEILMIPDRAGHILQRLVLSSATDRKPFRRTYALPLGGRGDEVPWTSLVIDGKPHLAVCEKSAPQIRLAAAEDLGWSVGEAFPCQAKVKSMAGVVAAPGSLLLFVEDAPDLLRTTWDGKRLTFPMAWHPEKPSTGPNRQILALGRSGSTTWWVQKVESELVLWRWDGKAEKPQPTVFPEAGAKAARAVWLGGEALAVSASFARSVRLLRKVDGKIESRELSRIEPEFLRLVPALDGTPRLGLLTDGVFQWLDADLRPLDQIMLDGGLKMSDYFEPARGGAWALEGTRLHRLESDAHQVVRPVEMIEVPAAERAVDDCLLGPVLLTRDGLVRLVDGAPRSLEILAAEVDDDSGLEDEDRMHRLGSVDVDGGAEEVLIANDARHRLTLLQLEPGPVHRLASWQVFSDRKYPYGEFGPSNTKHLEAEPRAVRAGDLDGDGRRDLALLCHDRILIYLSGTPETKP